MRDFRYRLYWFKVALDRRDSTAPRRAPSSRPALISAVNETGSTAGQTAILLVYAFLRFETDGTFDHSVDHLISPLCEAAEAKGDHEHFRTATSHIFGPGDLIRLPALPAIGMQSAQAAMQHAFGPDTRTEALSIVWIHCEIGNAVW